MSKSNFGEFPEIEGWYWLRYYRNNDKKPIMYPVRICLKNGEWDVYNGEYVDALSELSECEFCKIDEPE